MIVKQAADLVAADLHLTDAGPPAAPDLIGVLQALGDPMRLAIVRRLAESGERTCGGLAMPISKSTLTHHLHVLRAAGVILQRHEGTCRITSLDRDGMEQRFPGLLDSVLAAPAVAIESALALD
jgi:DNA-binding transcriptional ArsR family regulator